MLNNSQDKDTGFEVYLGNEMKAASQYPFFFFFPTFFPGVHSLGEFHSLKATVFSAL